MLSRHMSVVAYARTGVASAASTSRLTNPIAATPAVASSYRPILPAALSSHTLTLTRSLHNPRTIRGVGPRPRVPSFYTRPWLKRRLAEQRKKYWPKTHLTQPLTQEVKQTEVQSMKLQTREFESGKETGSVDLNPSIFSVPLRRDIIWEVVRWQRAMRRTGHHKNKNRAEVFGTGRKMRPQKGSGQARVGDMHAPHHAGGGNTWARIQSDYSYKLPQHIINLGKRVALSAKAAEGNLFIVDEPVLSSPHPKAFTAAAKTNGWGTFLMVHLHGELDPNLALSSRKFEKYDFLSDRQLNVYDIVRARRLIITRKALQAIHWRLDKANTSRVTQRKTMRWMVGSFGGGYTREEIDFVKADTKIEGDGKIASNVEVDGLKLLIKSGKPFETPVHWP